MFEQIINQFNEHIDSCSGNIESLTPSINQAATIISETLLKQGKIICIGQHSSSHVATLFCEYMQQQFINERPALPAIDLSHINAQHIETNLTALCQNTDVVLFFDHPNSEYDHKQITQLCKQLTIPCIICTHRSAPDTTNTMYLNIHSEKMCNILEIQLLIMHILCKLLDLQLFGYEDTL